MRTEKGWFYIVAQGKRYRISTERVLQSWSPQRVVRTTEAALKGYRVAAKMKFRNGSLIWNISDARIYLIEDGKRRWVTSPDVFTRLGLDPRQTMKEVICVSQEEINLHQQGEDLN